MGDPGAGMTPPHSGEAERSLIGGLLIDSGAWARIADKVTPDDFYFLANRLAFESIVELAKESRTPDLVAVSEHLDRRGVLSKVGGFSYLAELAAGVPSTVGIETWAEAVRDRAMLRRLIQVCAEVTGSCYNPEGKAAREILDEAEGRLFAIGDRELRSRGSAKRVRDLLSGMIDTIQERFEQNGTIIGTPTGFADLDEMLSGLQKQDLVVVAARPSMGKTAFALNIAEHAAIREEKKVLFFSMEMTAEQLLMRITSSVGGVDATKLRTGALDEVDFPRISTAVSKMQDVDLYIDETPGLTPVEIRARARRVAMEAGGLDLVVVDYMQLMESPEGKRRGRVDEISEISRSLKALAKEMDVPVVALSQLNRALEGRPNKRPVMSDLRDSGAIEQDADVILFLYRDEVYHEDTEDRGVAEVIVGKQRNGPIGMVRLAFDGSHSRFANLARGYDDLYAGREYDEDAYRDPSEPRVVEEPAFGPDQDEDFPVAR